MQGASVVDAFEAVLPDYEDAVQYLSAVAAKADVIVTRDKDGFAGAEVRVCTPKEFLDG